MQVCDAEETLASQYAGWSELIEVTAACVVVGNAECDGSSWKGFLASMLAELIGW